MFKNVEDLELNQISLTGMRSIVLLGLLIQEPRSLDEIRKEFLNYGVIEESHSNDILRIDLNTLKVMGCQISRASAKTNYKYVLGTHPFALKIEDEELSVLKKAYKNVKEGNDFKLLLDFDELLKKIASRCEPESKENVLGISALKHYELQQIKELICDCAQERIVNLLYKNPSAKEDENKEILAQRLVLQNDKVYLYGYDLSKKQSVTLNVNRIRQILGRRLNEDGLNPGNLVVRFHLKGLGVESVSDDERIVLNDETGFVVEGRYHTEFLAIQRMLSFGSDCTVLEPAELKEAVVSKLREMRKIYG